MGRAETTSLLLLETAERLFAEHGIEHVSMRQVVLAAGQRNVSALHYHFGTREGLVAALLNLRLGEINQARQQLLDALLAQEPQPSPRQVLGCSIRALAQTVRDTPWGASYVQVLAQATFSPRLVGAGVIGHQRVSGLRRTRELLWPHLAHLPESIARQRLLLVNNTTVYSIAHWSRQAQNPAPEWLHETLEKVVERLADFCTAGLLAACSPQASKGIASGIPHLRTGDTP